MRLGVHALIESGIILDDLFIAVTKTLFRPVTRVRVSGVPLFISNEVCMYNLKLSMTKCITL